MDGQDEVVFSGAACVVLCTLLKKKTRAKPKSWVRQLKKTSGRLNFITEDLKIALLSRFKKKIKNIFPNPLLH